MYKFHLVYHQEPADDDLIKSKLVGMGFFKQNGKFVTTYESCSTDAYRFGRTECIRPVTTATRKCVEAFEDIREYSANHMRKLIEDCSKTHSKLINEAAQGFGFDRHLFALRKLAESSKEKLPEMFLDSAYQNMNHNVMSTSTICNHIAPEVIFGPVVPDGYGIAYAAMDEEMTANISSFKDTRDSGDFIKCIVSSLDDIYKILIHRTSKI